MECLPAFHKYPFADFLCVWGEKDGMDQLVIVAHITPVSAFVNLYRNEPINLIRFVVVNHFGHRWKCDDDTEDYNRLVDHSFRHIKKHKNLDYQQQKGHLQWPKRNSG
ncbi:hypothetical protein CEXT_171561 [Caerostris extrusa]|uniref:Uncharacterized protein n=1 Tax=Caerostris extrusa TaxID=172846 RepID=A0AAV4QZK5_CAEEX|nr:hypothetical protein CEXT_171561 [Caerostris extrusa]